jgi:hypothetical protein
VHCEIDGGTAHSGDADSFDALVFCNCVTHHVAGFCCLMDGEDEFIYGIVEVEQLQVRLQG